MEADQKRSLLEWSNQRSFLCQRADHHIFNNCIGQPRSIFHVWGCYKFKGEDNTIWSIWWTKWKWSEWWTHFCQMISHYKRKHTGSQLCKSSLNSCSSIPDSLIFTCTTQVKAILMHSLMSFLVPETTTTIGQSDFAPL